MYLELKIMTNNKKARTAYELLKLKTPTQSVPRLYEGLKLLQFHLISQETLGPMMH